MKFFPGIALLAMAIGIFVINSQEGMRPINLPFLSAIPGVETRVQRGELTWQLLGGLGILWTLGAVAISVLQPNEKPAPTSDKDRNY